MPLSIRNRHYIPSRERRFFLNLGRRLTGRPVPRFPRTVQIQTMTGCNADCIFCPYGASHASQPHGRMEDDLFRNIIGECARHRVRRISPYLMNEPFLDPGIVDRIRYVKSQMPRCKVVVTTNGSMMRPGVIDSLLRLDPPLDALYISFQGIDPEVYRQTMRGGLELSATLENVEYLTQRMAALRIRHPRVWITMVNTGLLDEKRAMRFWRARGVRCKFTEMDNRGGNLNEENIYPAGAMQPNTTCTRLFKQAYILFNGDMVLCCADYSRRVVLGNVRTDSISAVWNGDAAIGIRRTYLAKRYHDLILCRDCRIDCVRERTAPKVLSRWIPALRSAASRALIPSRPRR